MDHAVRVTKSLLLVMLPPPQRASRFGDHDGVLDPKKGDTPKITELKNLFGETADRLGETAANFFEQADNLPDDDEGNPPSQLDRLQGGVAAGNDYYTTGRYMARDGQYAVSALTDVERAEAARQHAATIHGTLETITSGLAAERAELVKQREALLAELAAVDAQINDFTNVGNEMVNPEYDARTTLEDAKKAVATAEEHFNSPRIQDKIAKVEKIAEGLDAQQQTAE